MADHVDWPSFFWLNTALLGTIFLLLVFFFPETTWKRPEISEIAAEVTKVDHKREVDSEQIETIGTPAEEQSQQGHNPAIEDGSRGDLWLGRGNPSKQQFQLWQRENHNPRQLLVSFITPWKLLLFPIVQLAAFVLSWSASCFLILNLTQSQAFAAPPYNLSPQAIGLFNVAILVGAFIGLATNGRLSDWVSMRATRKNGGIREPEMRLPAMIPYVIVCIFGNFIVAFGYQYKWPWEVSRRKGSSIKR